MNPQAAASIAGTLVSLFKPADESERPEARAFPSIREAIEAAQADFERERAAVQKEIEAIEAEIEGLSW